MENSDSKKTKPYVKADLEPELDLMVRLVSKKTQTSKSSLVTMALDYFIRNVHPDAVQINDLEMYSKASKEILYSQILKKQEAIIQGIESIPRLEEDLSKYKKQVIDTKNKISMKEKSLAKANDAEKKQIENEIINLNSFLENKQSLVNIWTEMLKKAKKGEKDDL